MSGQADANESPFVRHTVQKGEWLEKIAQQFPETNWVTIAKENKLANADLVYPGQVLIIPVSVKSTTEASSLGESNTRVRAKSPAQSKSVEKNMADRGAIQSATACDSNTTSKTANVACGSKQKTLRASKKNGARIASRANKEILRNGSKRTNTLAPLVAHMHISKDRYATASVVVPPETTLGYVFQPAYLQLKKELEEIIDLPGEDVTSLAKLLYEKKMRSEREISIATIPVNENRGEDILPITE